MGVERHSEKGGEKMRDYRQYQPIPTEDLPAKFAGIFHMLALTFTPANDHTIDRHKLSKEEIWT